MPRPSSSLQDGGGLLHAWGVNRSLGAFLLPEGGLLHSVGRSLVRRSFSADSALSFLHTLSSHERFSSLALSPDGKYAALASQPSPSALSPMTADAASPQQPGRLPLDSLFATHTRLHVPHHQVLIVSLATQRVLATLRSEMRTNEFVHLAFSYDGKYLLGCARGGSGSEPPCMTQAVTATSSAETAAMAGRAGGEEVAATEAGKGEGRCVIFVWSWEDGQLLGTLPLKETPTAVAFKPNDPTIVSVSPTLRMYRLTDSGLFKMLDYGALRRHATLDTVSHAWISPSQVVFVTTSGMVALVADHHLRQELQLEEGRWPTCIAPSPLIKRLGEDDKPVEGALALLVGCSDGAVIMIRHGPAGHLALGRTVLPASAEGHGPVRGLHIGAERDVALVLCNAMCSFCLVGAKSKHGVPARPEDLAYEPVLSFGHEGPVLSVSAAVSRPLLFSVGIDRTLRSYEVETWISTILMEFTQDMSPTHVTAHPSGLHLLVGFQASGRVISYHISWTGVVEWQKLTTPSLRDVKYSTGGAFFAIACGNEVGVHSSYTLARLGVVCTHGSPIRSIRWALDDSTLAAGASDGMFYVWKVQGLQRCFEHRLRVKLGEKKVAVSSIALLDEGGPLSLPPEAPAAAAAPAELVDAAGNVVKRNSLPRRSLPRKSLIEEKLRAAMQMQNSAPTLTAVIVGSDGAVSTADHGDVTVVEGVQHTVSRVEPLFTVRGGAVFATTDGRIQLRRGAKFEVSTDTVVHLSGINDFVVSPGDRYVVTAGEDGSVFVVEGPNAREPETTPHMIVLCETRDVLQATELALFEAQIFRDQQEANHKIEKQKLEEDLRAELSKVSFEYEEKLKKVEGRLLANMADHDMLMRLARTEAADSIQALELKLEHETSHLESMYKREIAAHEDAMAELEKTKEDRRLQLEAAAEEKRQLEARAAQREKEHWSEVSRVKKELLGRLKEAESTADTDRLFEEEEHNAQLERVVGETRMRVDAAETEMIEQRMAAFMARKKAEEMHDKSAKAEATISNKDAELAALREKIGELKTGVKQLENERTELDHVLGEREKRCVVLREGQQRLEATVGVLQFRIKELEDGRAPLEAELEQAKSRIASLERALSDEGRTRRACQETNRFLTLQRQQQIAASKAAEMRATDSETFVRSTYHELFKMIASADRSWEALQQILDRRKEAAFRQGLREIGDAAVKGREGSFEHPDGEGLNVRAELTRQRDHAITQKDKIERRLQQLSSGAERAISIEHSQANQLLQTNFTLKKQTKLMEQKLRQAEAEIETLRKREARAADNRHPPHPTVLLSNGGAGSRLAYSYSESKPLVGGDTPSRSRPLTASASTGRIDMRSLTRMALSDDGYDINAIGNAELQALENQKLRENLLFFASSPIRRKGNKGAGMMSSSMPLPPV